MNNCIVHFLPANAGDCFVVEFDNRACILIDCGYKSTYENELPLLIKLRAKGCYVILMLITHIDQDHIEGAISFLNDNGFTNAPHIINVENIWFNGFFNTLFMRDEFKDKKRAVIEDLQKKQMNMVLADLSKLTWMVHQQSMVVKLPQALTKEVQTDKNIVVTITKNGKLFFNEEAMDTNLLTKRLEAEQRANANFAVIVNTDTDARHGQLVKVLDIIRNAGITKLAIVTQPE